jgi:hypothetical protein
MHNWPCPAALDEDELDQPGYQPTARWRHAHGTGIAADDPLGKNHQTEHRGGHATQPARNSTTLAGQAKVTIAPGLGA